MRHEVRRFGDAESVARAVAAEVAERIATAAAAGEGRTLVLAGGSTPRRTYEILAAEHAGAGWQRVGVWFGDERCVPPDHPDSNYAMAKAALLERVAVPAGNVHRILGELGAPAAAEDYERRLRAASGSSPVPIVDLALLGMGEDGHTASLFPGDAALAETQRWVVPVETLAKAPHWRVSLTLPALGAATEVFFLVTGAAKRGVLAEILRDPEAAAARYPAAAVRANRVVWFVDAAAAPEALPR